MNILRKSDDRGQFRNDWLNSYHSFSFGSYYDSRFMGVSNLRVINDDSIQPSSGFPNHSHQNMEIISYVTAGELQHSDCMGNKGTIGPGEIQIMSAGRGVIHSEYNPSDTEQTKFLQIWLLPEIQNIKPSYQQKFISEAEKLNQLKLLVSPDGREDSLQINSNAFVFASVLENQSSVEYIRSNNRINYIHLIYGKIHINGTKLEGGDGITIADSALIKITSIKPSEILLFDLPEVHQNSTGEKI